jgi:ribosomal peptide maturation radical SAM protein 1
MADNIMPFEYFRTLLPRLATECPGLHIFYEQKANLRLEHVAVLKAAGVNLVQPGIESLSTALLKRMAKGVTARQNIALLRYARAVNLSLNWNLLFGFPGDEAKDYQETTELVPLLTHLMPPGGLYHLSIDRFSPYFDEPSVYCISNLKPLPAYRSILRPSADIAKIAYHFTGLYHSGIDESPEVFIQLQDTVRRWQEAWRSAEKAPPSLAVAELADDQFMVLDTRNVHREEVLFADCDQARLILTGKSHDSDTLAWAREHGFVAQIDEDIVPLAVADPELLARFEHQSASGYSATMRS